MRALLRKIQPQHITWILAVAALIGALAAVFGDYGWKEIRRDGKLRMWKHGDVYHIDSNGDGLVDEEINYKGPGGKVTVRKDTNFDGYFDLRYNLVTNGIAVNIVPIHEKAPRHK